MEQELKIFQEYVAILRRYKYHMLGISLVGFILSALIATNLPSIYQSTATILIERQEMPQDIVRTMVSNYAEQRIQIINQKIMSSQNLINIINKFDLYQEERKQPEHNIYSLVKTIRESISMDIIGGKQIIDPRSGKLVQPTLAFTLSFESKSPESALQVANELVNLYLNENIKQRFKVVQGATKFLGKETQKLREEINSLEDELTKFKEAHASNLPEQNQLNLSRIERTELQISDFRRQISSATETQLYLKTQLEELVPSPTALGKEKLAELKTEYSKLSSKYSKEHPDVKKLKWEIANLKKVLKEQPELLDLEAAQKQLNNPDYIQIKARLIATQTELREMRSSRVALKNRLADYEDRVAGAPQIEREFKSLMREYENSIVKYRETKAKQREARMAQDMELNNQGNEFSLLEPPLLPTKHFKPNRPAILFLGFLASMTMAFGFLMIKEGIKPMVYTPNRLASITGIPPLVSIPYLKPEQGLLKKQKIILFIIIGLLIVAIFSYVMFSSG